MDFEISNYTTEELRSLIGLEDNDNPSEDEILELSGNVTNDFYASDGLNKRSILRCERQKLKNMNQKMK